MFPNHSKVDVVQLTTLPNFELADYDLSGNNGKMDVLTKSVDLCIK